MLLEASWSLLDTILGAQEHSGGENEQSQRSERTGDSGEFGSRGGIRGGDTLEESVLLRGEDSHCLQHPDKQG